MQLLVNVYMDLCVFINIECVYILCVLYSHWMCLYFLQLMGPFSPHLLLPMWRQCEGHIYYGKKKHGSRKEISRIVKDQQRQALILLWDTERDIWQDEIKIVQAAFSANRQSQCQKKFYSLKFWKELSRLVLNFNIEDAHELTCGVILP